VVETRARRRLGRRRRLDPVDTLPHRAERRARPSRAARRRDFKVFELRHMNFLDNHPRERINADADGARVDGSNRARNPVHAALKVGLHRRQADMSRGPKLCRSNGDTGRRKPRARRKPPNSSPGSLKLWFTPRREFESAQAPRTECACLPQQLLRPAGSGPSAYDYVCVRLT